MKRGVFLLALLALLACSPKVPQGTMPRDESKASDEGGAELLAPQLDILFVIDNSGSMAEHQANLSANIGNFISAFFQTIQIDFHIGVITTDDDPGGTHDCCGVLVTDPGNTPAVIDRNTPDFRNVLAQRMLVGTSGSPFEKMFDPVHKALTQPNLTGPNDGFLRSGASLAIVFITDAEDQSTGIDAQGLQNFLVTLKGSTNKVLTYGVIVPSSVNNCSRDDGPPVDLEQFLSFSPSAGNNEFSLCDPQFGSHIAEIGRDLATRVSGMLRLKRVPVVSTIRLMYGTQEVPPDPLNGWSFDAANNAIHIGPNFVWSAQPSGTQLKVYYTPTKFDDPAP